MIRVESLIYLQEVAKTKSIRKAADNLFLSKSALSVAIKKMEDELGVALISRSVSGTELTAAGEMVVEKANIIFDVLDLIQAESWLYQNDESIDEITYYMTEGFANRVYPSIMLNLKKILGAVCINARVQHSLQEIIDSLQKDTMAMGFYISDTEDLASVADLKDVHVQKIHSYKSWCVTAKYSKFLTDKISTVTMQEVFQYPIVQLEMEDYETVKTESEQEDDKYNFDNANIVFRTNNTKIYCQAIADDIGIGMLSRIPLDFEKENRKTYNFIPITDGKIVHLFFLSNQNCPKNLRDKHGKFLTKVLDNKFQY